MRNAPVRAGAFRAIQCTFVHFQGQPMRPVTISRTMAASILPRASLRYSTAIRSVSWSATFWIAFSAITTRPTVVSCFTCISMPFVVLRVLSCTFVLFRCLCLLDDVAQRLIQRHFKRFDGFLQQFVAAGVFRVSLMHFVAFRCASCTFVHSLDRCNDFTARGPPRKATFDCFRALSFRNGGAFCSLDALQCVSQCIEALRRTTKVNISVWLVDFRGASRHFDAFRGASRHFAVRRAISLPSMHFAVRHAISRCVIVLRCIPLCIV